MYAQAQEAAEAAAGGVGGMPQGGDGKDEKVVDAEYTEVKDRK